MREPFKIDKAITSAIWSGFAYGKPLILDGAMTSLNDYAVKVGAKFGWITAPKNDDVQILSIVQDGGITLAARGTDDFRKWLYDVNVTFTDIGGGIRVHTGFLEAVNAVWPSLIAWLNKNNPNARLTIRGDGHSFGGAVIRQIIYRLAKDFGFKCAESITFGEPRSFNRAGSRDYEKLLIPTWRVIDQADIVCRVPVGLGLRKRFPFFDCFQHVGQTAYFDAFGEPQINEPAYSHLESDAIAVIGQAFRKKDALIYDHGMGLYIDTMKAWKEKSGQ